MTADKLFEIPPFSLNKAEKTGMILPMLDQLMQHHLQHCPPFQQYVAAAGFRVSDYSSIDEIPFLPVSVFKNHQLKSIAEPDVFKMLTSSGTTGQVPSKIFLDKDTANVQTKALAHIVTSVIGQDRLPMLIIDSKSVLRDRASFSARGAGILGLSVFGKQHTYLLDDNYELNMSEVEKFLDANNGKPMLLFGFTFMVWQFMFQLAEKRKVDLSQAVLFHSGGWKKMIEMSVTNEVFKKTLKEKFGLERIHNFYGMVEQVGSVFIENSEGFLHCSTFSDIIIRNPVDFSIMPHGEKGLIQVISVLPESYPGISLLTEDLGICHGEDDASNGWKGKYFSILGRAAKAELRGCSDTFK
ncbi:MAG: acyl-protein synthetase [Chitinophagaceae bacterium]